MSSLTTLSLQPNVQWGDLPPELVYEIFHTTARLSTTFCLTLCQVSTWARQLALPHLYSTVITKTHGTTSQYNRRLHKAASDPSNGCFEPKTALRSIWNESVADRIVTIFEECDNLVHIALHADNLHWLAHASSPIGQNRLPHDAITRKQDLHLVIIKGNNWSLTRFINDNPTLTTPLFSKITHLRLGEIDNYRTRLAISHFTRLTHLAVPFWKMPDAHDLSEFNRVLMHQSLECLVIVIVTDLVAVEDRSRLEEWFQEKCKTERRVFLIDSQSDAIQREWEEEVRGGESIWGRALGDVAGLSTR